MMEDNLIDALVEQVWDYNEDYQKEIIVETFIKCIEATGLFDDSDDMIDLLENMVDRFNDLPVVQNVLKDKILTIKVTEGY